MNLNDLEIPMEADDEEALQEYKRKRNEHWLRLRRARAEWQNIVDDLDLAEFWDWITDVYGIKPQKDAYGNVTASYDVIDEKKYTVFLLKFGQ